MRKRVIKRAILLYQTGIANVYDTGTGGDFLPLLLQADFRSCEWYAAGLIQAGVKVEVWSCNVAGDARHAQSAWQRGIEATPFRESTNPPMGAKDAA